MAARPASRGILLCVAEEKPKIFEDGRDMFYSVAVIVLVMVAVVAFTGLCSFDRGEPDNMPVNQVDEKAFLDIESRAEAFPVRSPQVPEGWTANSARRSSVAGETAPTVGWVIGSDGYLQLTQTGVEEAAAVDGFDEHVRTEESSYQLGSNEVTIYGSDEKDVRDLRVMDLGEVRLLVTGAATDEDFNALFEATVAAEPLPKG